MCYSAKKVKILKTGDHKYGQVRLENLENSLPLHSYHQGIIQFNSSNDHVTISIRHPQAH